MGNTMRASDGVSARMATCYVEIDGNRFPAMNAKKLDSKYDLQKQDMPLLGKMTTPQRITGLKGTGSATFYNVSSRFRKMVLDYQSGGSTPYFNIYITNEDPQSAAGRQSVVLKDCLFDSISLASFDAAGDFLTDEISFTFENVEMPEEFSGVEGTV